jgi:hypothetical protein
MKNKSNFQLFSKGHKIIFYSLFIVSLLGGLILFASDAKAATQATATLTVTNSTPVGSNATITNSSPIVLTEATTTVVTATFTVTDNNGCEDIDSAVTKTTATLYRSNVSGTYACTPNAAECYAMSCTQDALSCTAGGSDLTATYTCTANVQFYADPTDAGSTYSATDWSATITPADNAGASTGGNATGTAEMGSLTAISVTTSISYGALALNANTGTTDQTTVVTNTGNRNIDTQVGGYGASSGDGYSMTCTVGTIPVANEKYSLIASTAYASKTALPTNTSPNTVTTAITKGASATGNIYWGMGLPATGVGGSCSGKVNFTAVNGA